MREEIILAANSKDVLAAIRRRFFPYTQQTIHKMQGDVSGRYYLLKTPVTKGNVLTIEGIPFLIVGETRIPSPPEEVYRFEVSRYDETRIRLSGECRARLKPLEDIFKEVWRSVSQ